MNHTKKCRNKIIELIRQSKQTYYQRYFEQNKKDSKAVWKVIHEIISFIKNKNSGNVSAIIGNVSATNLWYSIRQI